MSEIKPYINQYKNWGIDLLKRLNNLGDDNGAFNVWEELPVTGKDGEILSENHKGLSGILVGNQPSIFSWNGTEWDEVVRVPVSFQGVPLPMSSIEIEDSFLNFFDPSHSTSFFFVISYTIGSINFRVRKIAKADCSVEWDIQIPTVYGAGTTLFSVTLVDKTYNSALFHNNKLFFCVRHDTPATHRFYCVHESGYLVWTSAYLGPADFRPCQVFNGVLQDIYFVGQNQIVRLSENNGDLLASQAIPLTYRAFGRCFSPGKIFLASLSSASVDSKIILLDSALLAAQEQVSLVSAPFSGSVFFNSWLLPDPQNDFIYFFNEVISGTTNRVWLFNATQKSWQLIHDTSTLFKGVLNSATVLPDRTCIIECLNGASITKYELSLDDNSVPISFLSTLVPGGDGSISWTKAFDSPTTAGKLMQISPTVRKNYGSTRTISNIATLSPSGRQVVYFDNASFLPTGNFEKVLQQSTFERIYAESITTRSVNASHNLTVPSFSSGDNGYFQQNAGVSVGNALHLAACFSDSQQLLSVGYTGGFRGQAVGGLFFNCAPISGQLVSWYEHRFASSGAFIFDQRVGKFFWEVKPTQPEGILTSFPSTAGVCLTDTNFLGVGTEAPAYKVDVNGELRATTVRNSGGVVTSDPRMKLNITYLNGEDSWEIIQLIKPISFLYKPDFSVTTEEITQDENDNPVVTTYVRHWPLPQGIQFGYNADEAGETLPELIDIEEGSGIKYLNSGAIAPIVHQGTVWKINQLQQIIEQQQTLIESLTARVEALENAA